jgi:hypothetical protein
MELMISHGRYCKSDSPQTQTIRYSTIYQEIAKNLTQTISELRIFYIETADGKTRHRQAQDRR